MVDRAGRRQHHRRPAIVAAEIVVEHRRRGRLDRLRRAENGAADRLVGEGGLGEEVVDPVVGRIERGADLLHDDVLLALELRRVENRVAQDVGEDVDGERHVVLEDARVVGGRLDAGRRVDLAADRLDLLGDVDGRARARALERHVFEEVRQAVLVVAFRARPGADPDAERRALQMIHRMGDDAEAGRQTRQTNGHRLYTFSAVARLTARIWSSTALLVVGKRHVALRLAEDVGKPLRELRVRPPAAALTAAGNFAGCAVASVTIGTPGLANRAATARPTAVCGSARKPVARIGLGDGRGHLHLVRPPGGEVCPDCRESLGVDGECAGLRRGRHHVPRTAAASRP